MFLYVLVGKSIMIKWMPKIIPNLAKFKFQNHKRSADYIYFAASDVCNHITQIER